MASWVQKHKLGARGGKPAKHEQQVVDLSEEPVLIIKDILVGIAKEPNDDKIKYLNTFVELVKRLKLQDKNVHNLGFSINEILICLQISLLDTTTQTSTQIRGAGLRAIRHVLHSKENINHFNKLLLPFLVARSLDFVYKNENERLEAMKLIRKVLLLSPANFDPSLARCLIALANGAIEEKDRLLRVCLATLLELGVLNSQLFIDTGGVAAITRNLLELQTQKITESLCGVLLLLMDKSTTRKAACIDLLVVAAPYCDFNYKHSWKDKSRDERDVRFNCSRLALLSILRSWPGILHFCNPENPSGLTSIIGILYLNQPEVRNAVLDLLYELLGVPQPEWTDELSVALSAVDPCEPQATWRLNAGFVVAEGHSVLPHLAKTVPSITGMHLAVLLYCFYTNGLISALVEVIATSDTFISVRATVLLGELLRLIQIILPPECCNTSPALPTLLEYATKNKPQALGAVTALQQFHKLLKKRPASYSLYLDFILKSGTYVKLSSTKNVLINRYKSRGIKSKLHQFMVNNGDDIIKETGVLLQKDPFSWNWNLIQFIVSGKSGLKVAFAETNCRNFFKGLVNFFMPSNNKYSHRDLSTSGNSKPCLAYTTVGIELIEFLIVLNEAECVRLLMDLFRDILSHIRALTEGRSVHDCLFSPQHMENTQCQNYFLFIGRLARTEAGITLLNQINMFSQLQLLATTTNNECYVKLIISSMDYSNMGPGRTLLAAVLKCENESSNLYATQFLLILLRAGTPNFSHWGIQLLIDQLINTADKFKAVSLVALDILHEACEIPDCLETLIKLNPDLKCLGEKAYLLHARMLSHPKGFEKLSKTRNIVDDIATWNNYFVHRYTAIVEEDTSDILTLHQRSESRIYDKVTGSVRDTNFRDQPLPPHLYGQLAQHDEGYNLLIEHGVLSKMFKHLQSRCESDESISNVKASIWAVAHFATSPKGLELLLSKNMLEQIIDLAVNSEVFSVRGTAYYALGLIGTTFCGANELFKLGWLCARHNGHESWPIIQEEESLQDSESESESEDSFLEYDIDGPSNLQGMGRNERLIGDSPERFPSFRNKSSTMPVNQNALYPYHQRSLSESKTFELIKGYETKLRERVIGHRKYPLEKLDHSSLSETTVQVQTLSPITSPTQLSLIKESERKIRRHSESSRTRRDSAQSGHSSDKKSSEGSSNKLSQQDLMGYKTLHYLRKNALNTDNLTPILKSFNFMTELEKFLSVEDFIYKSSLSSLASIKKFYVNKPKQGGPIYLGICLPKDLSDLFPKTDKDISANSSLSDSIQVSPMSSTTSINIKVAKSNYDQVFHNRQFCIECFHDSEKATSCCFSSNDQDAKTRIEILKHIESLSNPLWYKQAKLALLQSKQKNPIIFQEGCLYSEVCKMISENNYRLNIRRFIHELFFEVKFKNIFTNSMKLVQSKKLPHEEVVPETAATDQKTLETQSDVDPLDVSIENKLIVNNIKDSLKLSSTENKFPIKDRES